MKLLVLAAFALSSVVATSASAQSPSAVPPASAPSMATPNADGGTSSQYRAGRATGDSSKMGIAGPESPVDSAAPNAESCRTINAKPERDKCLAKARGKGGAASGAGTARRP